MNSVPQTAAMTFAFSSVCFFFYGCAVFQDVPGPLGALVLRGVANGLRLALLILDSVAVHHVVFHLEEHVV